MGFGQHQSFYLREGWLHKGLEAIAQDNTLLTQKDAFEKLGIGKNMIASLRFWLVACGVAEYDVKNKSYHITEMGQLIFDNDSNLNLHFSKALIHYYLAKNSDIADLNGSKSATIIYWFFNELEGTVFEKQFLLDQYTKWATMQKDVAENSLKRDIECLIQMYDVNNTYFDPEDVLHSPLADLKLLTKTDYISKMDGNLSLIPNEIILLSIYDYLSVHDLDSITLNELVNEKTLPGKIFNLKQSDLLGMVYSLKKQGFIEFTQTNNLDTIHLKKYDLNCISIIEDYYMESRKLDGTII